MPVLGYLLYPMVVVVISRVLPVSGAIADGPWPEVTVAIAAHNEEQTIERAVRSVLGQAYPGPAARVLVGLDGCTDGTAAVLAAMNDPLVRSLEAHAGRQGGNGQPPRGGRRFRR